MKAYSKISSAFSFPNYLYKLIFQKDTNSSFHPTHYQDAYFGTAVNFTFNTYKLLTVEVEGLAQDMNPFAIPLEVARIALDKGKLTDENLFSLKVSVVRKMKKRNYERAKIAKLLRFLHYYVSFAKRENYLKFEEEINTVFQTQRPMGITEIIEQELIRQGRELGEAAGIQKEKLETLRISWKAKLSIALTAEITRLSEEKVREIFTKFERKKPE